MAPDIADALVRTIELKDRCTAAHTWRVVLYAREMALAFGLPAEVIERLTLAAALHDMGKIDVPDEVLQKPGPLTPAEQAVMRTHTVLGHERLVRMEETDPILLELVRHHHERVDGLGYPDGIRGGQIPLIARQFAVIDSFDAMTSVRPYRPALPDDAAAWAIGELDAGAGTRYCPECVERFVRLHLSGRLDWIMHAFPDDRALPWSVREPLPRME